MNRLLCTLFISILATAVWAQNSYQEAIQQGDQAPLKKLTEFTLQYNPLEENSLNRLREQLPWCNIHWFE